MAEHADRKCEQLDLLYTMLTFAEKENRISNEVYTRGQATKVALLPSKYEAAPASRR